MVRGLTTKIITIARRRLLAGLLMASLPFLAVSMSPSSLYAQDNSKSSVTVSHENRYFNLPVPEKFCDETENAYGKLMIEALKPGIKQMGGLLNSKIIVRKCESTSVFPWGYVSIGPEIGFNLTQQQFNQIQNQKLGNESLMNSIEELILDGVEEDLGIDIKGFSTGVPQPLLSDEHTNIFVVKINTGATQTSVNEKLAITSSTLIRNRSIDYFIYINADEKDMSLQEAVKILHRNAMRMRQLNPDN